MPGSRKIFSRHLLALLKKEWLHLWRDPLLILLFLSGVTVQMILFGIAMDSKAQKIPLIYSNQDETGISRHLLASLLPGDYFQLVGSVADKEAMLRAMQENRAQVGIYFPQNFSEALFKDQKLNLEVFFDGAQSNFVLLSKWYLFQGIQNFFEKLQADKAQGPPADKLKVEPEIRFSHNPELKESFFRLAGMMGAVIMFVVVTLSAALYIREKESGTLSGLQVSPIGPVDFLVGKALPIFLIGYANTLIGFLVTGLWFGIPLAGSLSVLAISSGLYVLFCIGLGFLIARISHTQYQAIISSSFIMFPSLFASGGMNNADNFPWFLWVLTWFNPQFYFVNLTRGATYLGLGWAQLWPQLAALTGFTLLVVGFSLWQAPRFFLAAPRE